MAVVLNYIIIAVGVLVMVGGGYLTYLNNKREEGQRKKPAAVLWILGIIVAAFGMSFTIIPTGYTGVLSTFGQISDKTLPNGFNIRIPLAQQISLVNNKQQDMVFDSDQIKSETIERNTVTFPISDPGTVRDRNAFFAASGKTHNRSGRHGLIYVENRLDRSSGRCQDRRDV